MQSTIRPMIFGAPFGLPPTSRGQPSPPYCISSASYAARQHRSGFAWAPPLAQAKGRSPRAIEALLRETRRRAMFGSPRRSRARCGLATRHRRAPEAHPVFAARTLVEALLARHDAKSVCADGQQRGAYPRHDPAYATASGCGGRRAACWAGAKPWGGVKPRYGGAKPCWAEARSPAGQEARSPAGPAELRELRVVSKHDLPLFFGSSFIFQSVAVVPTETLLAVRARVAAISARNSLRQTYGHCTALARKRPRTHRGTATCSVYDGLCLSTTCESPKICSSHRRPWWHYKLPCPSLKVEALLFAAQLATKDTLREVQALPLSVRPRCL
jgi:hypothetical protein